MGRIVNILFLLLITCIWASSFGAIQEVTRVMTPFAFLFWRFFLSFLCLFPWILWVTYKNRGNISLLRQKMALMPSLGLGVLIGFGIIMQTLGTTMTSTSRAAFITTFFIVLIPVFSYLLPKVVPKEWLGNFYVPKLTKMLVLGLICSFTGLMLIMLPTPTLGTEVGPSPSAMGDLFVMLCTLGLAGQIIGVQLLPKSTDVLSVTGLQFLWVSVMSLLGVWLTGEDLGGPIHWPGLIYMVLCVTVLTFLVQTWIQPRVNTVEAAAIYSLEPLFATLLAWAYLSERPTQLALIGGGLLICGVLCIEVFPSIVKKSNKSSPNSLNPHTPP